MSWYEPSCGRYAPAFCTFRRQSLYIIIWMHTKGTFEILLGLGLWVIMYQCFGRIMFRVYAPLKCSGLLSVPAQKFMYSVDVDVVACFGLVACCGLKSAAAATCTTRNYEDSYES